MGMERYKDFVARTDSVLTYDPGWSEENPTGSWRSMRPHLDRDRCNECSLCWLYCPDGVIDRRSFAVDLDYCKGCGICAEACAVDAIEMKREEQEP